MCGFVGRVSLGGLDRAALEPRLEAAVARLLPRDPDSRERRGAELDSGRRDSSGQLWTLIAFQAWWERRLAT
jgi:hypothetical protein